MSPLLRERLEKRRTKGVVVPLSFEAACASYNIRTKTDGIVAFDPSRWYAEQLRFHKARTGRDIILKPRQIGISTFELLYGLFLAQTRAGYNVRVFIHDDEKRAEFFRTVSLADASSRAAGRAPKLSAAQAKHLVYETTGSSIGIDFAGVRESTAEKKGRSVTIHRAHCTEVAYWSAPDVTMTGVIGAVPDDGDVVIESTANGAHGWFYDEYQKALAGESDYTPHFFAWHEHAGYRAPLPPGFDARPRDAHEEILLRLNIQPEQLAWWRNQVQRLTLDKALQEFPVDAMSCFRAAGGSYIPQATLDWLSAQVRAPLRTVPLHSGLFSGRSLGKLLVYEEPIPGDDYIVGADVSEGTGGDAHAADVVSRKSGNTVATFSSDSIEPGDFGLALASIGILYASADGVALLAPERNNHGHATLRALTVEAGYPRVYKHEDGKLGWPTTSATRPVMFDDLARSFEDRSAHSPDAAVVSELSTLARDKDGKPAARNKGSRGGARDDRVVARAIAQQVRARSPKPSKNAGQAASQRTPAAVLANLL